MTLSLITAQGNHRAVSMGRGYCLFVYIIYGAMYGKKCKILGPIWSSGRKRIIIIIIIMIIIIPKKCEWWRLIIFHLKQGHKYCNRIPLLLKVSTPRNDLPLDQCKTFHTVMTISAWLGMYHWYNHCILSLRVYTSFMRMFIKFLSENSYHGILN